MRTSLIAVLSVAAAQFAAPDVSLAASYSITDLGTLTRSGQTFGEGINASGQASVDTALLGGHAVLYSAGTLHDLGTLPGKTSSNSNRINAGGDIVGFSSVSSGTAFLYSGGVMQNLNLLIDPSLGWQLQDAIGINDSGQVVGYGLIGGQKHGFLYSSGSIQDLGTIEPHDINNLGQITGVDLANGHAFLYSGGVKTDLGTLGGSSSSDAWGVNESGQVAGSSNGHAFLYDGSLHDLGPLAGFSTIHTSDLNSTGQVVGYSYNDFNNPRAWVYTGGVIRDLNTLIDPLSGWIVGAATGINDSGQIIVSAAEFVPGAPGSGGGFVVHALILTPIPEPSTLALAAIGLVTLAIWRRKRAGK